MIFVKILQWTEIWATLIPLAVLIIRKPEIPFLKPVKIFVIVTFIISCCADLVNFHLIANNHFLYTLNSVCRITLFLWFFSLVNVTKNHSFPLIICGVVIMLVILNFIFFENFVTSFSSGTFSLEALVLLVFCTIYFFKELKSNDFSPTLPYALPVVIGLAIYEATCFPIFLFYKTLITQNERYAANLWNTAYNIVYIIFCLFLAKAFYGNTRLATS